MESGLLTLLAGHWGHFQMESGYHSEQWFDLDTLLADRDRLQPFVRELARKLVAHPVDAVVGPKTGGAKLADMIAAELRLESFHADRFEPPAAAGLFSVKYLVPAAQRDRLRGRSVAIVDDAISAGSAVKGTYTDLLACGAKPVAVGALLIFGEAADQFATDQNLQLESVARMSFGIWKPAECPLCRANHALEKVSDAAPSRERR